MRVQAQGQFTQSLWTAAGSIFNRITAGQFISRLADATLPHAWFVHYLSQDVLYLRRDNEALQLVSQRAPNKQEQEFFHQLAQDGIAVETAMQKEYLAYFSIREAREQSPAYSDFLLHHAQNAPFPVAIAALLPCFWLYGETGQYMLQRQVQDNPYQKFINTYSGETYDCFTVRFIQLVEQYGQRATGPMQPAMKQAFLQSCQFECLVFEEAEKQ